MSHSCPRCNSINVAPTTAAQKTCAAVGTVGGAIYGFRLGSTFGPIGMFTGALAGLVGGAIAGCEAGHAVGTAIDDLVIGEYQCNNCQHVFDK